MMEGFGVHTFRLINHQGKSSLIKFHWKPAQGVHSLVWEEPQILNGMDPDCHRRDLADAIESGKCYEQSIRERQLAALSNIDGELCQLVAAELGLAVPAATEPPTERAPSPAVSQLGQSWPVAGRVIGIVADAGSDPEQVLQARDAITAAGMLAPVGGKLAGTDQPVQRTYATARSVEFDAVVLATSGDGGVGPDPRVVVLAEEAFRHAKAIGGWGGAGTVLEAAGVDAPAPGVVHG